MSSTSYSYQSLITVEFPQQIFRKKLSNYKFHKNPSSGSRDVPCGQADGRTDTMKLIDGFRSLRTRLKIET